jgi:hypothetical protein
MKRALLFTTVFVIVTPISTAHAYIDPGTGSVLLQLLLGGLAGLAITLKLTWQRIKSALFPKQPPMKRDS